MAPYGTSKAAMSIANVSRKSSIESNFFKDLNSLKESDDSSSIQSLDESFSVQTPAVNSAWDNQAKSIARDRTVATIDESTAGGSFSFDVKSVNTPSVNTIQTPSVQSASINDTESVQISSVQSNAIDNTSYEIQSVQTPSIAEDDIDRFDDDMDQSTFVSVIESVIHSVVENRTKNRKTHRNFQHQRHDEQDTGERGFDDEEYVDQEELSDQIVDEEYDGFMNELSTQSVDIMKKRTKGLVGVISTTGNEHGYHDAIPSEDYDESYDGQYSSGVGEEFNPQFPPKQPGITRISTKDSGKGLRNFRPSSSGISRSLPSLRTKSTGSSFRNTSKNDSTIGGITSSFGISKESAQVPVKTTRNRFAKKGVGNGHKKDLEQRKEIESLLGVKKYAEMLEIIHENPKILAIQANQANGKTFLHVIASMATPPAENIILKVVSVDTSLVTVTDNKKNSPLHYAAQHVRKGNMHAFTVLLKFHPMGASERNSDGDLPLHIVASNPSKGAEEAAHLLLETSPKAISEPNNRGKIPLHLALTEGSKNLKLLMKIIKLHKFRKSTVDIVDNKGES